MKLDPEAVRIRKEHAKSTRQRVEVRRELSGNASIAGRELDSATALACKANVNAIAVRLRNHGRLDGTLSSIKALVMTELLQSRDPIDLIHPGPAASPGPPPSRPDLAAAARAEPRPAAAIEAAADPEHPNYPCCPGDPDDPGPDYRDRPDDPDDCGPNSHDAPGYTGPAVRTSSDTNDADTARHGDPDADDIEYPEDADEPADRRPLRPGMPAPLPASINLLVPIGTLLGWSAAPAHANGIGLLDPDETRAIVQAASQHPRTRWCATIITLMAPPPPTPAHPASTPGPRHPQHQRRRPTGRAP